MVYADLGGFFELFILGENSENDSGNIKKTKSLMYQSHFSCNSNYLLELSAYGNRLSNTLSWVINAVRCLYFICNCIFKSTVFKKKTVFLKKFERMVIIRTDPHKV